MAKTPDYSSMIDEIDPKINSSKFFLTMDSLQKKNIPLEFETKDGLTVKDAVVVLDIDATLVGSYENWKSRYNKAPIEHVYKMIHDEKRDDIFELEMRGGDIYIPLFGCFDLLRMLHSRNIRFCFFSSGTKFRNHNLVRWLLFYAFGEEEGKKIWDSVSVFSRDDMGVYVSQKDLNIVIGLNEKRIIENNYSSSLHMLKERSYYSENAESKSKIILPWIILADDRDDSCKIGQKENFLHVFDPLKPTNKKQVGEDYDTEGMDLDDFLREVGDNDLRLVYTAGVIGESISLLLRGNRNTPTSPKTFSAAVQNIIEKYSDGKITMRGLCALKKKKEEKKNEEEDEKKNEEEEEMKNGDRKRKRKENEEIKKKRKREG